MILLKDIIRSLNAKSSGKVDNIKITGINTLKNASENEISFFNNHKYLPLLKTTNAAALLVEEDFDQKIQIPVVFVSNVEKGIESILPLLIDKKEMIAPGISSYAYVGENSEISDSATIMNNVFVGKNVKVGNNTIVYPNVHIGDGVLIKDNSIIYPNVSIMQDCIIGNNVIIHSGSVIGADGFGYTSEDNEIKKIPQLGIVTIGDNVEIGACVTIDRARFGSTTIGNFCKIDNLVQIAHNVEIGDYCIIVSQAGIAGSTIIGNNVQIGAQAGIGGHLSIGNNVSIGAQSGVTKDIPDNVNVSGYPAVKHPKFLTNIAYSKKIPDILNKIKSLNERINNLENNAKDN